MKQFPVVAKAHPLKTEKVLAWFPEGTNLLQVVGDDCDEHVSVSISGEHIPREQWERIRPKAGTAIQVVRYPTGKTVKKIVAVVLLVIIAIYAPYLLNYMYTMYGVWGAVAAIGITLLATMAAYALIPPPEMPKMSNSGDAAEFNRLNAITGTSNQAQPYGTIPMVIGECRYYPTLAANPYTEILGDTQYLRMLLDLGYGDLEISDIKIGETAIGDFDDVTYEISTNPTLFSDDVFELSLADAFNNGAVVTKTSQVNADEISLDIVFGGGLFSVGSDGKNLTADTQWLIEFRLVGDLGAWTPVAPMANKVVSNRMVSVVGNNFRMVSRDRKIQRIGIRWPVTQGQYDVRCTRYATTFGGSSAQFDSAQLAVIRTIKHTNPSTTGTLKLALRIKATEQLNGVINQLSVLGQQKISVYDDFTDTWLTPAVNFNPAWIYNWLMTSCPGVAQTVDQSRMDLPALVAWAQDCDVKGFTTKGMVDRAIAMGELIKVVLSSGRASFAMRDGLYSVLYDRDALVPVQHFTPANSKNFTGQRIFIDLPHALRVKFQNPALNWQEDEIIVLDDEHSYDGKDARGVASALPAATKFETLTVPYVTEPAAAWMLARYHLAQAIFRPNTYSWEADIEHLICTRGDLVYNVHDVTDWGASFGLISDVVRGVGGVVTEIHTAEPMLVVAGQTYSIRARSKENNSFISVITGLVAGTEATVFTLATPMAAEVDIGDLYLIGNTESAIRQLLVTKIEPATDFNATIQAVEYIAEVQSFDDDPPSSFISAISGTSILEPPPPPNIYAVFSDPEAVGSDDLGGYDGAVNVGVTQPTSGYYNTGGGRLSQLLYRTLNKAGVI